MTLRDSFLVNIKIYSFKFESEGLDLYFNESIMAFFMCILQHSQSRHFPEHVCLAPSYLY